MSHWTCVWFHKGGKGQEWKWRKRKFSKCGKGQEITETIIKNIYRGAVRAENFATSISSSVKSQWMSVKICFSYLSATLWSQTAEAVSLSIMKDEDTI